MKVRDISATYGGGGGKGSAGGAGSNTPGGGGGGMNAKGGSKTSILPSKRQGMNKTQ